MSGAFTRNTWPWISQSVLHGATQEGANRLKHQLATLDLDNEPGIRFAGPGRQQEREKEGQCGNAASERRHQPEQELFAAYHVCRLPLDRDSAARQNHFFGAGRLETRYD